MLLQVERELTPALHQHPGGAHRRTSRQLNLDAEHGEA